MKKNKFYFSCTVLSFLAAVMVLLSGCGPAPSVSQDKPQVAVSGEVSDYGGDDGSAGSVSTAPEPAPAPVVDSMAEKPADPESVGAISKVGGLQAGVETGRDDSVVLVDQDANPYDVEWDYGKDWEAYVGLVDWDLLFDADYYGEAFPCLALLYHDDEELLLRHFQTVGVHEGRQGNGSFNVLAYMDECPDEARKAFGEDYECYYLYWALNQETQSGLGKPSGQPEQACVKLTKWQSKQLVEVNGYRKMDGSDPIEFDPELAALANYRAWVDMDGGWEHHDWAKANTGELDRFIDLLGSCLWSENTVHDRVTDTEDIRDRSYTGLYANSESHRDAMCGAENQYIGISHTYGADTAGTARLCHYQTFADKIAEPVR